MAQELTVDHVRAHLAPQGYTVEEIASDSSTATSAAQSLDVEVGAIVKSLLFVADESPVLALVSGDRTLNTERLATHLGARQVRLARPREVVEVTGYRVGGVPPVAHRFPLPTLLDQNLLRFPRVFAAAGSSNAIFGIAPQALAGLTGGSFEDLAD